MKRPRVLLADDHSLICEALTRLLEPHCDVVGTVGDGRALLNAVAMHSPDIVVVDIAMPLLNGLDAARQLRESAPRVKIIFLTMNEDPELAAEAFRLGASGYLLKHSAAKELLQAISEVYQGRSYVTPLATKDLTDLCLLNPDASSKSGGISNRQREVLQLLAEGHSMKSIARILQITPRTVAFHKYRIMEELKIKSNAELVQYAIKHRLISI